MTKKPKTQRDTFELEWEATRLVGDAMRVFCNNHKDIGGAEVFSALAYGTGTALGLIIKSQNVLADQRRARGVLDGMLIALRAAATGVMEFTEDKHYHITLDD